MLDRSLKAEFEDYRKTLPTDEVRQAFDARIEHPEVSTALITCADMWAVSKTRLAIAP